MKTQMDARIFLSSIYKKNPVYDFAGNSKFC